ncbi:glutamyl-tRNA reductase [uncultured Mobiluncus sp.]|uniref:glutamyl-tRNA reductase n=1 Tax=uncultured Mobiluncus sp. TaxID=293425 RepID=UPI0026324073|nr:glutamyl-tRNA reductase [uncultured Mobiluncus sp.]
MPFQLYTVNHLTHSLAEVAQAASQAAEKESEWFETPGVHSLVLVSTCNRVEIYASADPRVRLVPTQDLPSETQQLTASHPPHAQNDTLAWNFIEGRAVAEHLYRVAAGLDSMVVGEAEVAGQVRRSFTRAQDLGEVHGLMVRMFEGALSTARKVASKTELTGLGRSVVSVGLDVVEASGRLPEWRQAQVLLVGTGAYAGSTVAQLRARGVRDIANISTSERVTAFAKNHGTRVIPAADLVPALQQADLVVTARGIGAPVLRREQVRASLADPDSSLTILDLALHRDVEESVRDLPGVALWDLEDIRHRVPALAVSQVRQAHEIIEQGLSEYDAAVAARHMDPAIVQLRAIFQQAAAAEIDRLPAGEMISREAAEAAIHHVIAKLAHTPTVSAHMAAEAGLGSEWVDALATVWGLTPDILEAALNAEVR